MEFGPEAAVVGGVDDELARVGRHEFVAVVGHWFLPVMWCTASRPCRLRWCGAALPTVRRVSTSRDDLLQLLHGQQVVVRIEPSVATVHDAAVRG
ncbi:Uncharacterised protein [Mycobacteroides abscessus]|nr:Uncharacterised protein [Mycobacteroides abscessus]